MRCLWNATFLQSAFLADWSRRTKSKPHCWAWLRTDLEIQIRLHWLFILWYCLRVMEQIHICLCPVFYSIINEARKAKKRVSMVLRLCPFQRLSFLILMNTTTWATEKRGQHLIPHKAFPFQEVVYLLQGRRVMWNTKMLLLFVKQINVVGFFGGFLFPIQACEALYLILESGHLLQRVAQQTTCSF